MTVDILQRKDKCCQKMSVQAPLGELIVLPRPRSWILAARPTSIKGVEGREKGEEGKGGEGNRGERKGGYKERKGKEREGGEGRV